ncbi:MAG: hypothetical protein AAF495_19550 [Pseudomonadota bacterium]
MLDRLNRSILANHLKPHERDQWENKDTPAGYTYLLQFAAHDLVHTSVANIPSEGVDRKVRNLRGAKLELETIFGGGPAVCPHAFEAPEEHDSVRRRLRLGQPRNVQGDNLVDLDRELFRTGKRMHGKNKKKIGMTDVLIADPRNDDNSIIAQLTALFHAFYNVVLAQTRKNWSNVSGTNGKSPPLEDADVYARAVTAYAYRTILRKDLLKRLLDPEVYEVYDREYKDEGAAPKFLDNPVNSESIPLEFSHAAIRIGHVMVRPRYKLNPYRGSNQTISRIIRTSSRRSFNHVPLRLNYLVDWAHFFEVDPQVTESAAFNWAAKFGLHSALDLGNVTDFPVLQKSGAGGLLLRDMVRGQAAKLWSVDGLCDLIQGRLGSGDPGMPNLPSLPGKAGRTKNICAALKSLSDVAEHELGLDENLRINESDTSRLKQDPPLFLYVLVESQMGPSKGTRLGPLGSIIMGEVFFRAMSRHPDVVGPRVARWERKVAQVAEGVLPFVPTSMSDLIDIIETYDPPALTVLDPLA